MRVAPSRVANPGKRAKLGPQKPRVSNRGEACQPHHPQPVAKRIRRSRRLQHLAIVAREMAAPSLVARGRLRAERQGAQSLMVPPSRLAQAVKEQPQTVCFLRTILRRAVQTDLGLAQIRLRQYLEVGELP